MTVEGRPARELSWHRRTFEILVAAGQEFAHDKVGRLGAALAFYSLFAFVPLLFLAAAAAGIILGSNQELERVVQQVASVTGTQVADVIERVLRDVVDSTGSSLLIGIPLAAFTASGIFLQAQRALNQIFHVPEVRHDGVVATVVATVLQRLVALVSALILATLVLTPIVAVTAIHWISDQVTRFTPDWVGTALGFAVPLTSLALLVVVAGITFQILTSETIPWEAARKGGVFTALLVLAAAYVVGVFLGLNRGGGGGGGSPAPNALGVLGGVAVLLFFFNLLWQVYLFGAEVTKVYADYLEHGDIVSPSERVRRRRPALAEAREQVRSRGGLGDAEAYARVGIFAFVAGLVLGWVRRPRP